VSGSGISWAVCKTPPRSRQITTPAPHHSVVTGRMPFLPPNQQRQSTEGMLSLWVKHLSTLHELCINQKLSYRRLTKMPKFSHITVWDMWKETSVLKTSWIRASFRHNTGLWQTDRQTDGHTTTAYTVLPQRRAVIKYKKLSYRRVTARCVVSVEILPIATQQCRNYLYGKSWIRYQLSLIGRRDKIVL